MDFLGGADGGSANYKTTVSIFFLVPPPGRNESYTMPTMSIAVLYTASQPMMRYVIVFIHQILTVAVEHKN